MPSHQQQSWFAQSVTRAGRWKQILGALALLGIGYLAGTLRPHALATDGLGDIVRELHDLRGEIHTAVGELTSIRRAVEKGHR